MTNDQRKTIRIQKALRFPNGKFWDGLQIFGTARKENFFKAVQHFQTLRIIGQKNLFIIWRRKKNCCNNEHKSAKETLVELYFCFFDGELHVNSDHDGDSAEDEDHNDQFNAKL